MIHVFRGPIVQNYLKYTIFVHYFNSFRLFFLSLESLKWFPAALVSLGTQNMHVTSSMFVGIWHNSLNNAQGK
jgi:hypothetical protein